MNTNIPPTTTVEFLDSPSATVNLFFPCMLPTATATYKPIIKCKQLNAFTTHQCKISTKLKASVRYFLSSFYFFTKWWPLKNYEKCFFISSKKLLSFLRYSDFYDFSLHFQSFQIQKNKWKWNNLWCRELACINLQI